MEQLRILPGPVGPGGGLLNAALLGPLGPLSVGPMVLGSPSINIVVIL